MKEINKEILDKIKIAYKKYAEYVREKKQLSTINKQMKTDFIENHFGDEEKFEPIKKKVIKKEVGKYFRCLDETGSGSDPVIQVKDLRKNHLNLEDTVYEELMTIFDQIEKNIIRKDEIDDSLEQVYRDFGILVEINDDIAKGILDLWYKEESGKFPITVEVVGCYKKIAAELNKEG